jgi:hypothetical protein
VDGRNKCGHDDKGCMNEAASFPDGDSPDLQNGFTITRITMPIISTVGTSLIIR